MISTHLILKSYINLGIIKINLNQSKLDEKIYYLY
jgi:hypothetical protein